METKKWKTAIANSTNEGTTVRGYGLIELIKNVSFTEAIFLVLKGQLPNDKEKRMMGAMLVSSIDHGIAPPSAVAARTIASGGNSFNTAVAGGILTLGDYHGGAIERCAKILQDYVDKINSDNVQEIAANIVDDFMNRKERLPGFGHRIYKEDPRTKALFELAEEIGFSGRYVELVKAIESELEARKGKKLCINIDGSIAAIVSEMGFDWRLGKAFFIISRTAGLCAHVHEEITKEKPFRGLKKEEYEYIGEPRRELPK